MLQQTCPQNRLRAVLVPRDAWRPFPPASDRAAWAELGQHPLNQRRKAYLVGRAESLLGRPWPALPATLYMDYIRTGDRARFQSAFFARRQRLAALVLAECIEHQGRFIDEIINGLWAISEEATWCVSAHAHRQPIDDHRVDPLPRQDVESVDLFACETAMALAEAAYLLADELDAVSPAVCERVRRQVMARVIEPVEKRNDFWWLGGRNNWTPWCSFNTLGAAMYVLDDPERLAALTWKLMGAVDRFIAGYGADGGCDEGPGYWGVAAGAMLVFLELLHSRTNGAVDVYDEPLIANMGLYLCRVHLDGPWFTNFADASARCAVRRAITFRYGERVGSDEMKNMALLGSRGWAPDAQVEPPLATGFGGDLTYMLREMFWMPPDARPESRPKALDTWLPDLQVMIARQTTQPGAGLVLAAKAGHNGENHNHNDVGQFILLLDSQPIVVDVGVESYTRKTFSDERYDIWCIRSSAHNVPLVNGWEQAVGREHAAADVTYRDDGASRTLSMELAAAYPNDAGIVSLRREIVFSRTEPAAAAITDSYELAGGPVDITLPLFIPTDIDATEPGRIVLGAGARKLVLEYDPGVLSIENGSVEIMDGGLRTVWGKRLARLQVRHRSDGSTGSYRLTFRVAG